MVQVEGTEQVLQPVLPDLLNEFFRIMGEIGSDTVVSALDAIIEKFGDDLVPHATVLVQKLCETFVAYAGSGEEDDEAAMAASQCIEAIDTVLGTVQSSDRAAEIHATVEPHLLHLLAMIFEQSGEFLEYLETALEILIHMTFVPPVVSPNVVAVLPAISYAFHKWAYDYIPNMVPPLDNIIGRAPDAFLASAAPDGTSYLDIVLGMVEKVYSNGGRSNERECMSATYLLMSLMHNCPGRIDHAMPSVIGLAVQRLFPVPQAVETVVELPVSGVTPGDGVTVHVQGRSLVVPWPPGAAPGTRVPMTVTLPPEEDGDKLRMVLLMALASAFHYNPALTLAQLQGTGNIDAVFQLWFKELEHFDSHLALKLSCLGLSALLQLPATSLPQSLAAHVVGRAAKLAKALKDAEDDEDEEDEDAAALVGSDEEDGGAEDEGEEGFVDDEEDAQDGEEIAYMKSLRSEHKKMMAFVDADDWQLEDENDFSSPIDDVDETAFFLACLQGAFQRDHLFMQTCVAQLAPGGEEHQAYQALTMRVGEGAGVGGGIS
mmetsp:Transcript_26855/g.78167  ORF Transcript_26855/g.78167 Transcript_26855/m.78167 type:complete len:545 (-) Transcript_26855:507-2141(-)